MSDHITIHSGYGYAGEIEIELADRKVKLWQTFPTDNGGQVRNCIIISRSRAGTFAEILDAIDRMDTAARRISDL